MNPIDRRLLLGAAGLAGVAAVSKLAHAGPIEPPPGPISPTGLTLDQLAARASATAQGVAEPRIPLSAETTPPNGSQSLFTIGAPGSYYLTGNITANSNYAVISIGGHGITLDLCGFTIRSAAQGVGVAIMANGSRITIRNGVISGYATGVRGFSNSTHLLVEDLALACTQDALILSDRAIARRCTCVGAAGTAIQNEGNDAVISDCIVAGPGAVGIYTNARGVIERCHVSGCNVGIRAAGHACRVVSCTAASNAGIGFDVGAQALVQDCLASYNIAGPGGAGVGINATGGVTATGCRVTNNAAAGILAGADSSIDRCDAAANGSAGLTVGARSRVARCTASNHTAAGAAGIRLTGASCIVEENHLAGNTTGVDAFNVGNNLITRNTMLGNTNAIAVNIGGNWYPNIPLGGVNTSTNPLNNVIG